MIKNNHNYNNQFEKISKEMFDYYCFNQFFLVYLLKILIKFLHIWKKMLELS